MTMITKEQRQQRLHEVPEEIFQLYASMEITAFIKSTIIRYGIQNKDEFIDIIGDMILGLIPKQSLAQLLTDQLHFEPAASQKVATDFAEFMANVKTVPTTPVPATPVVPGRLELRPQGINPLGMNPETSVPKPMTREELLQALALKRTMAGDIELARMNEAEKQEGGV